MKFLDCHMHQGLVRVPVETFLDRLDAAGVDSAIVFSYPPAEIGLTEPGGPTEPGDRIRTRDPARIRQPIRIDRQRLLCYAFDKEAGTFLK